MLLKKPLISIVSPAFNEEEVLPHFYAEVRAILDTLADHYDFELIFVDDGSSDNTLKVLRELANRDCQVGYLSLSRNFGHQAAYSAGLEHVSGDAVIMMDSDLQHPPALLPQLLQQWQGGHDVVVTLREGKRPGVFRNLATKTFLTLIRRVSSLRMRENMADYCLLSRRALDSLLRLRETHRYLRGMIQWLGYPVAEINFVPRDRQAGHTKFTMFLLLGYGLDSLISFTRAPLRLAYPLGFFFLLLGLILLGRGLLGGIVPGWETNFWFIWLLASVHLVGGSILIAMGLLGEYVGRIFEQVKSRPPYLLKESNSSTAELQKHQRSTAA